MSLSSRIVFVVIIIAFLSSSSSPNNLFHLHHPFLAKSSFSCHHFHQYHLVIVVIIPSSLYCFHTLVCPLPVSRRLRPIFHLHRPVSRYFWVRILLKLLWLVCAGCWIIFSHHSHMTLRWRRDKSIHDNVSKVQLDSQLMKMPRRTSFTEIDGDLSYLRELKILFPVTLIFHRKSSNVVRMISDVTSIILCFVSNFIALSYLR